MSFNVPYNVGFISIVLKMVQNSFHGSLRTYQSAITTWKSILELAFDDNSLILHHQYSSAVGAFLCVSLDGFAFVNVFKPVFLIHFGLTCFDLIKVFNLIVTYMFELWQCVSEQGHIIVEILYSVIGIN